jgi:peptide subunit release factor 1 (eRF1)
LRQAAEGLDGDALGRLETEGRRAMQFLEHEFEPQGRTRVIFSSEPRGLWVAEPLQAEMEPHARFSPRPFLRPLEQHPEGERACFVIIDRENARVLSLLFGSVELDRHSRDYFPRKVIDGGRKTQVSGTQDGSRQGGDASSNEQRSREAWAEEHFQKTCALLDEIDEDMPFAHLIIAGTHENAGRFIEAMPDHLRNRIIGQHQMQLETSVAEIVDVTAGFLREERERSDLALISEALDGALSGGRGSAGWDDVLVGLTEGRTRDVIVDPTHDTEGVACPEGHFVAREIVICPICGSGTHRLPSLVDAIDDLAGRISATVRLVNGEAAEKLAEHDGIAARLRY